MVSAGVVFKRVRLFYLIHYLYYFHKDETDLYVKDLVKNMVKINHSM